jgi:predicted nucleic acid-binding protein
VILVDASILFERPQSVAVAWRHVEEWLDCECVWLPAPGPAHRSILAGLLRDLGGGSKLLPDAHLAALAIEHGLALCSCDGDFARFKGLRWINPLAS